MAQFYEKELVDKELWPLGEDLRVRFEKTKQLLLKVQSHKDLLGGPESQLLRQKLALRGPYVTPLNVLQVIVLFLGSAFGSILKRDFFCLLWLRDCYMDLDKRFVKAWLVAAWLVEAFKTSTSSICT